DVHAGGDSGSTRAGAGLPVARSVGRACPPANPAQDDRLELRAAQPRGGGGTLEAAEAVCNTRRDLGSDAVDALSSLLDKSLVQQVGDGDEVRFSMLGQSAEQEFERV